MSLPTTTRMPAIFVCHGAGPFGYMDTKGLQLYDNFLKDLDENSNQVRFNKEKFPEIIKNKMSIPRAILLISSHWVTGNDTYHISGKDFFTNFHDDFTKRFPNMLSENALKKCHYPVKVDIPLANQIFELLQKKGIPSYLDQERDIDQGAFVPLSQLFPNGDIPVVTMSILSSFDPEKHFLLGEALEPLREQGVLIIGSGSVTHDLTQKSTTEEAHEFVQKLKFFLSLHDFQKRRENLVNWKDTLPNSIRCQPPPEDHFIPLLVVAGCAGNSTGTILNEDNWIWNGTRSCASFIFE